MTSCQWFFGGVGGGRGTASRLDKGVQKAREKMRGAVDLVRQMRGRNGNSWGKF